MEPCVHPRRITVSAKCNDQFAVTFPSGHRMNDYMPSDLGLGGGDYTIHEPPVCTRKGLHRRAHPRFQVHRPTAPHPRPRADSGIPFQHTQTSQQLQIHVHHTLPFG